MLPQQPNRIYSSLKTASWLPSGDMVSSVGLLSKGFLLLISSTPQSLEVDQMSTLLLLLLLNQ